MRIASESRIKGRFKGWSGDAVFRLANGQVWKQARYAYHYHYAYQPRAVVYEDRGAYFLRIDGMDTDVQVRRVSVVHEGYIRGAFNGWHDHDTTFQLDDGSVWRQAQYHYEYHYDYQPDVLLYEDRGTYMMHVDGMSSDIEVKRA